MATLLEDLQTFLIAANEATALNSFLDFMPDAPDNCIGLYEYSGHTPAPQIAGTLRSLQIVCRSKSPTQAKQMADRIYHLFEVEDGIVELTPDRSGLFLLAQPPFRMRIDTAGRPYYGFNASMVTHAD